MNIAITVFESVVVLLGIGLIGFFIMSRKIIAENVLGSLSSLALDIALPSLVFVNILLFFKPSEIPDWWMLPLWWLVFTGIVFLLTMIFRYVSKKQTRSEFSLALFFQNGIFMPLAILTGLYGGDSFYIAALFLFTLFYPALFFNTYYLFFNKKIEKISVKKIFNPVLIATLLAMSIRLLGFQELIPNFFVSILQLLAAIAVPVIMLVIGGNMYLNYKHKGTIYFSEIIKFVMIKNIVFPLIILSVIYLLQPPFYIALILLLQSAVPPVTPVSIFTQRVKGNHELVNQFIISSFLFSVISIPLMFSLFTMIYPL
jgi:malate permease and related proteins